MINILIVITQMNNHVECCGILSICFVALRCSCDPFTRWCLGAVPTEPLHQQSAPEKGAPVHPDTTPPVGRPVRVRFCPDALPQDGLPCPHPDHAPNQVGLRGMGERG